MSLGNIITTVIETNTDGDTININGVVEKLGCAFTDDLEDTFIKGRLPPVDDSNDLVATIAIHRDTPDTERKTVIALLISKFIMQLAGGRISKIECDTFFLSELRQHRMSPQVILSTRLLIPEHVIPTLDALRFNSTGYAQKYKLMTSLVDSAFRISDPDGLFGMLRGLNSGLVHSNIGAFEDLDKHALRTD